VLSMGLNHALAAGKLPGPHRDPFDRMLMAQAAEESMLLVSNDRVFRDYGVNVLW
jgi:PIN domain nuclease of toxin-antitoxin system